MFLAISVEAPHKRYQDSDPAVVASCQQLQLQLQLPAVAKIETSDLRDLHEDAMRANDLKSPNHLLYLVSLQAHKVT